MKSLVSQAVNTLKPRAEQQRFTKHCRLTLKHFLFEKTNQIPVFFSNADTMEVYAANIRSRNEKYVYFSESGYEIFMVYGQF